MEANKRKPQVCPNSSVYGFRNNESKKFSPNLSRRPMLNDTICFTAGSNNPKIKTVPVSVGHVTELIETECDIAYNNHLQALLKQQIIKKKTGDYGGVLKGQLVLQSDNLQKINQMLGEISKSIEMLQNQSDIVEIMNCLQGNTEMLKSLYAHQTDSPVETGGNNVKSISTQQEYDWLMNVLKNLLSTLKKINNSGRDFHGIHLLAEDIRNFVNLNDRVKESQKMVFKTEKDTLYTLLQNISDLFAKKYDSFSASDNL